MSDLIVTPRIRVAASEFRFRYDRSSGPGGQNVNKVNSKVTLHWGLKRSKSVSESLRQRFVKRFPRRINQQGEVVIASDRYRDQLRNRQDCLEKLRGLLLSVSRKSKPRRPTTPTRASQERRIENKKRRGDKKTGRRPPTSED